MFLKIVLVCYSYIGLKSVKIPARKSKKCCFSFSKVGEKVNFFTRLKNNISVSLTVFVRLLLYYLLPKSFNKKTNFTRPWIRWHNFGPLIVQCDIFGNNGSHFVVSWFILVFTIYFCGCNRSVTTVAITKYKSLCWSTSRWTHKGHL